jgi:hypothetical protein
MKQTNSINHFTVVKDNLWAVTQVHFQCLIFLALIHALSTDTPLRPRTKPVFLTRINKNKMSLGNPI